MNPTETAAFLDGAIRSRIAIRLIAEQHISLTRILREEGENAAPTMGVVDPVCSPADMLKMCGSFVHELCEGTLGDAPQLVLEGQVDATFT